MIISTADTQAELWERLKYMETTSLYAEMIIIGLETSVWISMVSALLTDFWILEKLKYILEKLPAAILLLGLLYIVGIVVDRAADTLWSGFEKKLKKASKLEVASSILIWKSSGQDNYFVYTRSRIRILRASVVNFPLITLSTVLIVCYLLNDCQLFCIFIALLGTVLTVFSFVGYRQSIISYYKKARLLELDIKKSKQSAKNKCGKND